MINGYLLWVDDEIEQLHAQKLFLESKGYDVATVSNGTDAIDLCRERHFDLVGFADRPEYRNAGDGVLGPYDVDFFFGCELTGLGKVFFDRQLMSGSEKDLERFFGHMDVTRGCFYKYFFHIGSFLFAFALLLVYYTT